MLIMPTTTTDFQALADGIVDDFFRNDVALMDGIAKVAVDRELTPEEITRLTEKTNTSASLYFLKTAEDKKAAFQLADVRDVLRMTHAGDDDLDAPASEQAKAASLLSESPLSAFSLSNDAACRSVYTGLPKRGTPQIDLAACFFPGAGHKGATKTASKERPCKIDLSGIFVLEKMLAERKQEKMAMELTVQDGIDFLASEFHVWNGPDFGKFAADSLAAYGDVAMPVLEGLAAYLHIPGDEIQKTTADTHQDYVDDTTPHMKVMGGICDGMSRIVKLSGEIRHLEQSLRDSWKEAKEGIK